MTAPPVVPPGAIDEFERQILADLHAEFRRARGQPWFTEASPEGRAVLDIAIARVEAHALLMLDGLRVKSGCVSVH